MYKVCFIDIGTGPGAWALTCGGRELRAFEMATDGKDSCSIQL